MKQIVLSLLQAYSLAKYSWVCAHAALTTRCLRPFVPVHVWSHWLRVWIISSQVHEHMFYETFYLVVKKVLPYLLPSVGPGADPGVQAVSPQVTWSESRHKPGGRVGCYYFPPGLRLPPQPLAGLLRTEAHGCWQLAQGSYRIAPWPGIKLTPRSPKPNALNPCTTLPSHPILPVSYTHLTLPTNREV